MAQDPQDTLYTALHALTEGNPSFDRILWDSERMVLSFHRAGCDEHVNLWLHRGPNLEHIVERNGGPGGIPITLWEDGYWEERRGVRQFYFRLPGDRAENAGGCYVTADQLPIGEGD